ncbi:hypothetical protein [Fodinicola acaciae]|uniref:hypothetical protein n=1 Tax=Fodinicola acaciae TaxID=2681555 RepID=UPI0013D16032|nr:hypothetical protein [Fodinicola acaciae]
MYVELVPRRAFSSIGAQAWQDDRSAGGTVDDGVLAEAAIDLALTNGDVGDLVPWQEAMQVRTVTGGQVFPFYLP